MTAAFDTRAAGRTLREAGADDAVAEAVVDTAGAGRAGRATTADVADLRADMRKGAIGVVIANATLAAVLVVGAGRRLRP